MKSGITSEVKTFGDGVITFVSFLCPYMAQENAPGGFGFELSCLVNISGTTEYRRGRVFYR